MMISKRKKVVILGAGFAGVYAYLELLKHDKGCNCLEVTMVNRDDYFSFIVLAHEVATGGLMPQDTKQPIHNLPKDKDTRFIQGIFKSADLDNRKVTIERTDDICTNGVYDKHTETIDFDYLIVALGSSVATFGVEGIEEHALTLKNIDDAKKIKNRILDSFEVASFCKDKARLEELLSFVVIGGGPTGVELVAEMADFIRKEIRKIYPDLVKVSDVTLIHGGDRLLNQVDEWFHEKSYKILRKLGVHVMLNARVTAIKENTVVLGEDKINARNIFWSAGVKGSDINISSRNKLKIDERSNRIKVNKFLQTEEYTNVYVVGDLAWVVSKETGQPYPMRAQFAVREGVIAAKNIIAEIHGKERKEFSWKDQGFIISLGRGGALAEIFGLKVSGPFAWWLYRTAYLMKLVGIRAKLRTGLEWAINLIFSRDISKLS